MDNFKVNYKSSRFDKIINYNNYSKKYNGLFKIEYDYLVNEVKTYNFDILQVIECGNNKYVTVFIKNIVTSNVYDLIKIIQIPKIRKYYINNCYYNYFYIYTFKTLSGNIYEKINKTKILDKNNHFRPIKVGYVNSKGDVLISYTEELRPVSFTKRELIGVELIDL